MEYTTNAPKGAALLDERVGPGWAGRIDLETFDIKNVEHCVLAQVYGTEYFNAKDRLFTEADYDEYDTGEGEAQYYPPYEYGFDASPYDNLSTETWNAEWRQLISERQIKNA